MSMAGGTAQRHDDLDLGLGVSVGLDCGRLLTDGETVELYDIAIDFEGLPEPDDQ